AIRPSPFHARTPREFCRQLLELLAPYDFQDPARRALAAARILSRRRVIVSTASGADITTASICLQNSGSPNLVRTSAMKGYSLLNVPMISPCAARKA